jgi:hypothetical protein
MPARKGLDILRKIAIPPKSDRYELQCFVSYYKSPEMTFKSYKFNRTLVDVEFYAPLFHKRYFQERWIQGSCTECGS